MEKAPLEKKSKLNENENISKINFLEIFDKTILI
jgi:hypothetical protein